ncbi:cyclin-O-like isoform X2 [Lingula anatina]|nr:cyclin-O-like isoform X2 [Lingula anatina]|eukprot:XP_023932425.1 cyclin-O-like isoform X2 [Lingula anatina]
MTKPPTLFTASDCLSFDAHLAPIQRDIYADYLDLDADHAGFVHYNLDTYIHRRATEMIYHPKNCLDNQSQVTVGMRAILIQWLTKVVHQHFRFHQDTLYLTVNILDRFLASTPVKIECFQLLGVTALLVAGKHEEIYPPEVEELIRLCCGAYDRAQIIRLERLVLERLGYTFMVPTTHYFLEQYSSSRLLTRRLAGCTKDDIR